MTAHAHLLRAALLGALAWAALALLAWPGLPAALLLVGPLVAVPLGLTAVASDTRAWRAVAGALLPAALLAALAFTPPAGRAGGALALPWLGVTLALALLGLARARVRGPGEGALTAALLLLPVGAAWLGASRAGLAPLGFGEPVVLLTAAHFHFAGFVLPVLAGRAARARSGSRATIDHGRSLRSMESIACAGVVAGVPAVALGIAASGPGGASPVEALAAWLLTGAALLVAALQLLVAARAGSRARAGLLALSGASLIVAMALAAAYALGRWLGASWLDIPTMVETHAALNVLGFALPGLLAWTEPGVELRPSWRRATLADLARWEARPPRSEAPSPDDHRDAHERDAGQERPGPPEPDGPHRRAAAAILRYDVFPPAQLEPLVRRAPVQVGDTLLGAYHLLPGVDLLFASRVVAVFDGPEDGTWRTGFTYRTLEGHAELGEETFSVEKDLATGRVRVALRAWSRPGAPVTAAVAPIARWLQVRAGRAGAARLAALAASRA